MCILVVTIITPPENTTACRGSDVNISCGYQSNDVLPVTWIINGIPYNSSEIENSLLYQLNNIENSTALSLTVFAINYSTSFQCIVDSQTYSTDGMVTVVSKFFTVCFVHACMHVWLFMYVCIRMYTYYKVYVSNVFIILLFCQR